MADRYPNDANYTACHDCGAQNWSCSYHVSQNMILCLECWRKRYRAGHAPRRHDQIQWVEEPVERCPKCHAPAGFNHECGDCTPDRLVP